MHRYFYCPSGLSPPTGNLRVNYELPMKNDRKFCSEKQPYFTYLVFFKTVFSLSILSDMCIYIYGQWFNQNINSI